MLAVLAAAVGGCDLAEPGLCTLVACTDGLLIEFNGTPAAEFTVIATADTGETESLTCTDQNACLLVFRDFTPPEVTIRYESSEQTIEQTFTPEYERTRPNGPDCPPECLVATVVVDLQPPVA